MGEKIKEFIKSTKEISVELEELTIKLVSLIGWITILIFAIKGMLN